MGVVWMNAKSACLKRETKQIIGAKKKPWRVFKHIAAILSIEFPKAQMAEGCQSKQRNTTQQASLQSWMAV